MGMEWTNEDRVLVTISSDGNVFFFKIDRDVTVYLHLFIVRILFIFFFFREKLIFVILQKAFLLGALILV
jgi:hypothetical protein